MDKNIKVYIKINESNIIVAINSQIFLKDLMEWIEIDEGKGDKYVHAQNNYFEKGLVDEHRRYNYKYIDDTVVEIPEDEKPEIKPIQPKTSTEARLQAVEEELNALLGV